MTAPAAPLLPPAHDIAPGVLALKPRALWAALKRQPISAWSVYAYLFFEYVRPQSIYPALSILPFARIALLTALFSSLALEAGKRKWTAIDTGMVIYTIIVLLSVVFAFDPGFAFSKVELYLSWVIVYYIISTAVNTQTRVVMMLLGWFLWNFKMSQHGFRSWAMNGFAFRDWGVTGAPGWFQNSGEFGIEMCVFMPISLFFALGVKPYVSRWMYAFLLFLPITAVSGAIASSSRGALVGMAAVAVWAVVRSRFKVRGAVLLVLVGLLAWLVTPEEQKLRMSASGDDATSTSRLKYWERGMEFANEHPLLGIGYANWMPYYEKVWGARLEAKERVQLPHNFLVECVAELGYTGLAALFFLIGATFWINYKTRALAKKLGERGRLSWHLGWGFDGALIGFVTSGFFVTVLYYPYLWVNLAMTVALHLSVARAVRAARLVAEQQRTANTIPFGFNPAHAAYARPSGLR